MDKRSENKHIQKKHKEFIDRKHMADREWKKAYQEFIDVSRDKENIIIAMERSNTADYICLREGIFNYNPI